MANPDIPAALTVLATHLTNAGAAMPDPILDVDRGLPTGGRMIRYYWGGEVPPPKMGGPNVLNGRMVGQRFEIAATWPATTLSPTLVTAIDTEMQLLAGEIRTRIQGDSQLGGNVTDLDLDYAAPDVVTISNARYIALRWTLDLSYVEYAVTP
jgi:hypothetical protein